MLVLFAARCSGGSRISQREVPTPEGKAALCILNASNSVCVWVWVWTVERQWKSQSNGQMVIRRQNSCWITIQPFDRLFQIWQMVIRQLFCRRVAIQPFRLKIKPRGTWGIWKTRSTNLLLFAKNCVNVTKWTALYFWACIWMWYLCCYMKSLKIFHTHLFMHQKMLPSISGGSKFFHFHAIAGKTFTKQESIALKRNFNVSADGKWYPGWIIAWSWW